MSDTELTDVEREDPPYPGAAWWGVNDLCLFWDELTDWVMP